MKTVVKSIDKIKNLWKDGQNNYYLESDQYMYPYDKIRDRVLNKEIKLPIASFSKMAVAQSVSPSVGSQKTTTVIRENANIPDDRIRAINALTSGS